MTSRTFQEHCRRHFLRRGHRLQRREPAMGYASRLAALAGVDLWTLVHDMRIPIRDLARGDASALDGLADLRELADQDRDALARYTPRRVFNQPAYTLAGHWLPPQMILTTSTKVCPHCIAEDLAEFDGRVEARPWQRTEWVLAHVHCCARHGTMLTEVSPSLPIHIGHDFSKTVAEQVLPGIDRRRAEASPAPGTACLDWLTGRLDGPSDPRAWLDDAPLHAGIIFCEALGISILHPPMTRPSSLSQAELCRAIHEGYSVASGGAQAVRAALDEIVRTRFVHKRGSAGQERVYGHVYHALDRVGHDPAFAMFQDFLREHAFGSLPFPAGRKILGARLEKRQVHTVATAAKAYAHANSSMRRMLAACAMEASETGVGAGVRAVLSGQDLDALVELLSEHLNTKEVAALTGFTIDQVDIFAEKGWLPTLPEGERPAGVHQRYLRREVESLMGRLFRDAETVVGPEGRRMTVTQARIVTRTQNAEIFGLIHDGRLAWVGRHGAGRRYENLLVDADEVRGILRPAAPSQGFTAIEAMELLPGVHKTSFARLARAGLLTFIREYRPDFLRTVRLYSRTSVEAFQRDFITAGEIARMIGLPPTHVVRRLATSGITEVVDYATVRTKVYRRGDVLRQMPLGGRVGGRSAAVGFNASRGRE